jgi:hypothetical protein
MAGLRIFLCHAPEDKERVRELADRLTKDGFDIWLDEERLLPGQDWDFEITHAVRNSDVVVVWGIAPWAQTVRCGKHSGRRPYDSERMEAARGIMGASAERQ